MRSEHFYRYLLEDLFSPRIVGWQVFDGEGSELPSQLLCDICTRHRTSVCERVRHGHPERWAGQTRQ